MSNLDVNNPYLKLQPDSVGVKNNKLVVDTNPTDFGTFAVSTLPWTDNDMASDKLYQMLPYERATTFRINNYTGKTVGIRRRHKSILIDDFEDLDNSEWTGTVTNESVDIDGFYSGNISGLAHRPLTTQPMLDNSEVEVKLRTGSSDEMVSVKIWDNVNRIDSGQPAAVFTALLGKKSDFKVILRMRPSIGKYDSFLESPERQANQVDQVGEFGTLDMINSCISIEANSEVVVDSIVYQKKVDYSPEHLLSPCSATYPCYDNIAEYEVVNLGSDALNYSDTNIAVTLSGLFAV